MTAKNNTLLAYPAGVYAFGVAMMLLFPWQPEDDDRKALVTSAPLPAQEALPAPGFAAKAANDNVRPTLASGSADDLVVCAKKVAGSADNGAAAGFCQTKGEPKASEALPAQTAPAEAVPDDGRAQQSL